jgi:hypothetical protein
MAYKLVTCPETAHIELIDLDEHPLGILVKGCSRFRPACQLACTRACSANLDRRDRRTDPQTDPEVSIDIHIEE